MSNNSDSGAPRPPRKTTKKTRKKTARRTTKKATKKKPTGDAQVGYCRPPKDGQFKPGQSGNLKGRPTKKKLCGGAAAAAAHAKVWITQNGKRKCITIFEASLLRLIEKALQGDRKAQTEVLSLNAKYARMKAKEQDTTEDDEPVEFILVVDGVAQPRAPDPYEPPPPAQRRARQRVEAETDCQIFTRVYTQKIAATIEGKQRKMTIEEGLWRKLFATALAGDVKTVALIRRFFNTAAISNANLLDEDEDMTFTLNLGPLPALDDDTDWDPLTDPPDDETGEP